MMVQRRSPRRCQVGGRLKSVGKCESVGSAVGHDRAGARAKALSGRGASEEVWGKVGQCGECGGTRFGLGITGGAGGGNDRFSVLWEDGKVKSDSREG